MFLQYYLQCQANKSSWPFVLLAVGIARSLFCGGWVYITSTDHHDAHDVLMISYIVCNVPWMFGSISYTPSMRLVTKQQRFVNHTKCNSPYPRRAENTSPQRLSARSRFTAPSHGPAQFLFLHYSHGVFLYSAQGPQEARRCVHLPCSQRTQLNITYHPSAYTRYSFFEWGLIFLDITFDAILATDLRESGLRVRPVSSTTFQSEIPCSWSLHRIKL